MLAAAEARAETAADEDSPLRRCAVSRQSLAKEALIRFVVGPDGVLVPDLAEKLPGRGLWIAAARDILARAEARDVLSKAARRRVDVPAQLADRIEALLVRRCQETLGLARRSGKAVAGFDKVCEWLRRGRGHVILAAADGAGDGRDKVRRLAAGRPVVEALTAAELGAAFGRDHVVHAVVDGTGLGRTLARDGKRLAGLRPGTHGTEERKV